MNRLATLNPEQTGAVELEYMSRLIATEVKNQRNTRRIRWP